MSRSMIIGIVIVVLVLIGGFWAFNASRQADSPQLDQEVSETSPAPATPDSSSSAATDSATQSMGETMVTITSTGFSPRQITIKAGEKVTWTNNDTKDHTVNSAPHPTHTTYPPLNVGNIAPGSSKSLVFPEAGTYMYHDHLNPSLNGSVTVQ